MKIWDSVYILVIIVAKVILGDSFRYDIFSGKYFTLIFGLVIKFGLPVF